MLGSYQMGGFRKGEQDIGLYIRDTRPNQTFVSQQQSLQNNILANITFVAADI